MKKRSHHKANVRQALPAFIAIVFAGGLGAWALGLSFAATTYSNNPVGAADYCLLSGSTTTIYGWAYDANAPAGSLPNVSVFVDGSAHLVASNIAGYRDTPINTWLSNYPDYAGAPHMGTYGWKLSLTGLYKGATYTFGGSTIINYGAGTNSALTITTTHHVDNDASKPYFSGGKIPDACLATKPAPIPIPTPTPTPIPAPTPVSSPNPSSGAGTTSHPPTNASSSPTASALLSEANASVTTGTTSAAVTVPTNGAAKVHLVYGPRGAKKIESDDRAVTADSSQIYLGNLKAATKYEYNIVRTDAKGVSASSTTASFTTKGFTVALHFTNNAKQHLSGVSGAINDSKNTKATSDSSGTLTFKDLPGKTYSIVYSYGGHRHAQTVNTSDNSEPQFNRDNSPAVITLDSTVNVDKLSAVPPEVTHRSLLLPVATIGLLLCVIVIVVVRRIRRRREQRLTAEYGELSSFSPAGTNAPNTAHIPEQVTVNTPMPAHAGESLRDMVILSMANQAQQPWQTPGQPEYSVSERSAMLPPQRPAQPASPPPSPLPATEPQTVAAIEPMQPTPEHKPITSQRGHKAHQVHRNDDEESSTLHIDHRKRVS
jgi:hypothetical protein